jgi:hypothetical protein
MCMPLTEKGVCERRMGTAGVSFGIRRGVANHEEGVAGNETLLQEVQEPVRPLS